MTEGKEKTCFIIMPIADDVLNYESGHFRRVYEYIIKPAVFKAGFIPKRADDVQKSNYIMIDILQSIINSDMCVCDLSSRNPNVMYELGIRQAFNLPVTLIKDKKTPRIFDIQGLRDVDYEENLRIDNVESAIEKLSKTITNTYKSTKEDVNSIVQLLGVSPAKITKETKLSDEASVLLKAIEDLNMKITEPKVANKFSLEHKNRIYRQTVLFYDLRDGSKVVAVGDRIKHTKFGVGEVIQIFVDGTAKILFV